MIQSSKTQVSCSECPYASTSRVTLHENMKRSHNNLYCQMMSNGQLPSSSFVSSQKQGDTDQPIAREVFNSARRSEETFCGSHRKENLICDKSFIEVSRKHVQRVHTGEKPFQCKQCDMSFRWLCHLNTHQRVHTGEKPFVCKQCDKSFSELGNLKRYHCVHTRASAS